MPPLKAPPNDSGKLRPAMSTSRAEARCETPDLAIRPSTSGGPGEPTTIFHSKVIAAPSVCSQDQAPALPSYPSFPSFPNSTATLSTNGVTAEEQAHIGIALGSPTVGSHWVSTPHGSNATMMHFPQSSSSPVAIGNRQVAPKSKRSKWKALFRKAAPSPAPDKPSFYQVTQAVMATTSRADSHHGGESPDSQVPLQEETVRAQRTQPPMYKPGTKASPQRAPEDFVAPASPPEFSSTRERTLASGTPPTPPSTTKLQGVFTSPVPPSKDTSNHAQEEPKQIISGRKGCMSTPGSEAGSDQRSLLDVTIPDVTMERYSVMFGTVLQSGTKRSSSLLERRQANAEKIKPLSKLSVQVCCVCYSVQLLLTSAIERRAGSFHKFQTSTASHITSTSRFPTTNTVSVKSESCSFSALCIEKAWSIATPIEDGAYKVTCCPNIRSSGNADCQGIRVASFLTQASDIISSSKSSYHGHLYPQL